MARCLDCGWEYACSYCSMARDYKAQAWLHMKARIRGTFASDREPSDVEYCWLGSRRVAYEARRLDAGGGSYDGPEAEECHGIHCYGVWASCLAVAPWLSCDSCVGINRVSDLGNGGSVEMLSRVLVDDMGNVSMSREVVS